MHYYSVFKDRRPQGQTETISLGPSAVNRNSSFLPISYEQRTFRIVRRIVREPCDSRYGAILLLDLQLDFALLDFAPLGGAKIHGGAHRHQTRDHEHRSISP